MARIRFAAGVLVGAVALRLMAGPGLVNYDTLYALVWGRELAHGSAPDLEVAIAPTPHPLADLAAIVLSPLSSWQIDGLHGEPAALAVVAIAYVSLALLGWVVFALGREWFNTATGVLATVIVLTRVPVLDFGARAYVDIPFLVLVLGALLVETRSPRSGAPVLGLLALAGLLRPEAWLFSAFYLCWLLWPGLRSSARHAGPRRARGVARCGAADRARRQRAAAVGAARPAADRRRAALADRHARQRRAARPRHGDRARADDGAAATRRDPARARACSRPPAAACSRSPGAATGACDSAPPRACSRSARSACWRPPGFRSSRATCC